MHDDEAPWPDEVPHDNGPPGLETKALVAEDAHEVSALADIEKSRAIQEVQVAILAAKRFPRDTVKSFEKIMKECKRHSLAKLALYNFPRGKDPRTGKKNIVEGPSIRLAEAMARSFGNLDYGWREIERRRGSSICQAYCWDMENNVIVRLTFDVPHEIGLKGGRVKKLTDPRDIYELCANQSARRLRKCILEIIPGDVTEEAVLECRRTVAKGDGVMTLEDRIRKMALAFAALGVSQEMVEERLGHKIQLTTPEELVDLTSIHNSLKDGTAKRGDFFNFPEDEDGSSALAAEFRNEISKDESHEN